MPAAGTVSAKICGITTVAALDAAIGGGASHVGFVFFDRSPRAIALAEAAALATRAAGRVKIVGLFVDPEPGLIDAVRAQVRLNVIQLHGAEEPALVGRLAATHRIEIWKAVPVKTAEDLRGASAFAGSASRILYDAKPPPGLDRPGGTGQRFDWALLDGFRHPLPWVLSGGLNAANVDDAIDRTGATLVDVSSGVESAPGVKEPALVAAFLKAVAAA